MFSARRALSKLSSRTHNAPFAFSSRLPEILVLLRTAGTHASERADTEFYGNLHGDSDPRRGMSHDTSQNAQGYYQNNTYSQGQFHHNTIYNQSYQETYNNSYNGVGYNQQIYSPHGYNSGQLYQRPGIYEQQVYQYPNVSTYNNANVANNDVNVETPKYRGTIKELEGLCKEGKLNEAFEVLALLEGNKTQIGPQTYVLLIKVCGDKSDLEKAHHIQNHILQNKQNVEIPLNNKLLDMYIKCGSLDDARKLFDKMLQRNLTSWETMILGMAKNGKGEEALDLFNQLKTSGLPLDAGIFSSVFFVCGVIGAVDEGMLHLKSMEEDYQIAPEMGTYVAIVSMLGQSGYLEEAMDFIEQMPVEPTVDIWEALMNLARLTGDLDLGSQCAAIVERLESSRLLDNNSQSGLVPVNKSELEKEKQRQKLSRLEGRAQARQYVCGDRRDPEHKKIYALLNRLAAQMKEFGYVPDTRFVLHDVDQEAKEEALLGHSERLAAASAFMTSPARTPIRIIKNLRCCGDCHNALKIISQIVGREIIARDAKRFHNFKDGVCSCNDYW
ncbi:Pentatricopeptide repeat-containing protein [Rhynchospora pubera]|uniref:Pentatricopeptide repeat-containing protein n=1 Tax=Rhynchospora pubera TaxID=906938 RepID=A0AAV8HV79_9POAL|nr:Pentatricopeptide repeat-containing protein [Rhynchospora pubera]